MRHPPGLSCYWRGFPGRTLNKVQCGTASPQTDASEPNTAGGDRRYITPCGGGKPAPIWTHARNLQRCTIRGRPLVLTVRRIRFSCAYRGTLVWDPTLGVCATAAAASLPYSTHALHTSRGKGGVHHPGLHSVARRRDSTWPRLPHTVPAAACWGSLHHPRHTPRLIVGAVLQRQRGANWRPRTTLRLNLTAKNATNVLLPAAVCVSGLLVLLRCILARCQLPVVRAVGYRRSWCFYRCQQPNNSNNKYMQNSNHHAAQEVWAGHRSCWQSVRVTIRCVNLFTYLTTPFPPASQPHLLLPKPQAPWRQ